MPLIHCNFFSHALSMCVSMDVILPLSKWKKARQANPEPCPTLYLLHGFSDDHTIWQRRTSIERYVDPLNVAVVMPTVHLSFYTDMAVGLPYWTFLSEEVPYAVQSMFHLSAAREDNFAAGLSMGGYGAFKLALGKPERFAAAASLSGAVDVASIARLEAQAGRPGFGYIFGDPEKVKGSANDLFALARQVAKNKALMPRLYQYCGTEDFLYKANLRFRKHAEKLAYDLTYVETPGDHQWKYWDEQIQQVLKWLPLKPLE